MTKQTEIPRDGAVMTASAGEPTPTELAMAEVDAANRDVGRDAIKLGILTPLTPPGDAVAGVIVCRGARLGVEYVREHGGVLGADIELVAGNDMATAAQDGFHRSAVGAMAKLAVVDQVLAAFGQWHLRTAKWVVEVCEGLGVPMFVENGYDQATHRRRSIFRTYFAVEDRVPVMMDCLASVGARRIGLLSSDTVFAKSTADSLQAYGTAKHGMEFLRLDFEQELTTDWHEDLRKIAAWQPDAFIDGGVNVTAGGGPVGNAHTILKQAIDVGLLPGPALMVTFGFPARSADYWRMAGQAGNGVMWPSSRFRPSWPGMTDIGRWFSDRYQQRFGSAPPDTSLSAFTDVTVIAQALERAGSPTRPALIDALEAGEFDTWRGPVRFERGKTHWHHSPPELQIIQYQSYGQSFDRAAIVFPAALADAPYADQSRLERGVVPSKGAA